MDHWYPFGLFSILINVVFVFMHPFLPESPRWLLTVKKYKEAADLINYMRIDNSLEPIENLDEKLGKIFKLKMLVLKGSLTFQEEGPKLMMMRVSNQYLLTSQYYKY